MGEDVYISIIVTTQDHITHTYRKKIKMKKKETHGVWSNLIYCLDFSILYWEYNILKEKNPPFHYIRFLY